MPRKKVVTTIVENPWTQLVSSAESLYINVSEQYKISPRNELSSMLVSLSSIINSIKQQHNVWESRK